MVTLTLQLQLPIRLVCVVDGQDLQLEGQGPQPGVCVVKCPTCGFRVRLIQGPAPPQPRPVDRRMPAFRPQPKT